LATAPPASANERCIVIVEAAHAGAIQILGLMVDGVNSVMEIGADRIEQPPAFGTAVDTDFIAGMARVNGRFVILLDMARVLSIDDMAVIRAEVAAREWLPAARIDQ
jgi:purine-binding chemotaxis protein CheW